MYSRFLRSLLLAARFGFVTKTNLAPRHVRPGALIWRLHYGKDKLIEADDLTGCDIIISTYQTISAEWVAVQRGSNSILFSTHWRRIILDEGKLLVHNRRERSSLTDVLASAHVVRNTQSQMSKAVCALNATSRWAVTGTPIQNKIGDLAALLKFIRAYPYTDTKQFESDIGSTWKAGNIEDAANKLRMLSSGLILRRSKTVIELPARTDEKFPVEFSPPERDSYDRLKHQTIAKMDQMFHDGGPASNSYISVMQRINALRMVCDLGMNYDYRHSLMASDDAQHEARDWRAVAQETFNLHREMIPVVCAMCDSPLDSMVAAAATFQGNTPLPQAWFSKCRSYVCGDCAQRRVQQRRTIVCEHDPGHSVAPVSTSWVSLEETSGQTVTDGLGSAASLRLSSKVSALVSQLGCLPGDVKRFVQARSDMKARLTYMASVVFSSWRMSLDLVEIGLKQARINYVRFDGKVRQQDRQSIIEKFRKDPTVRVFLLTLSCGAVGYGLFWSSSGLY